MKTPGFLLFVLGLFGGIPVISASQPSAPPPPAVDPDPDGRLAYQTAMRAHTARNYSSTYALLKEADAKGNLDATFSLYGLYLRGEGARQDNQRALELLHKAIAQGHAPSIARLGSHYEHGGLMPKNLHQARHWYQLAVAKGSVPIFRRDLERVEQALARAPRNANYYAQRSVLHYDQRNYEASIADLTEALDLEAGHTNARYNRMLAYYYSRRHADALADADHLLARNPSPLTPDQTAFVHHFRGDILTWLERPDDAEQAYATALALDATLADRTRATGTREWAAAQMLKSQTEVNRILANLDASISKSAEQLRQANAALNPTSTKATSGAPGDTAETPASILPQP